MLLPSSTRKERTVPTEQSFVKCRWTGAVFMEWIGRSIGKLRFSEGTTLAFFNQLPEFLPSLVFPKIWCGNGWHIWEWASDFGFVKHYLNKSLSPVISLLDFIVYIWIFPYSAKIYCLQNFHVRLYTMFKRQKVWCW